MVFVMRPGTPVLSGNYNNENVWATEAPLTEISRRHLRNHQLRGFPFRNVAASHFTRAIETARIVASRREVFVAPWLGPCEWLQDWEAFRGINSSNLMLAYELAPLFLKQAGWKLWMAILEVARMSLWTPALLVSHSPVIECAAAAAEDVWPPRFELSPGDALLFYIDIEKEDTMDSIQMRERIVWIEHVRLNNSRQLRGY